MKTLWIDKEFAYDGSQLKSLFAYLNFSLLGDSIISWQGPCDIPFEHMVDGEDVLAQSEIRSAKMLHFIVEKFETSLFSAVLMQRMLAALCLERLRELLPKMGSELRREGDDIYWQDHKLSISIATVSPVSALVHFAVNTSNENTPVKTCALSDFNLDVKDFAEKLMKLFETEINSSLIATQKVHWVK
jgi:hypothetical protein